MKETASRSTALPSGTRIFTNNDLGCLLRSRRKELGYTQEDIAAITGFSPRLIGEMERGRGTVGIDRILTYATGLGIDIIAFER